MNKALKRSIYASLAALMLASSGAAATSQVRVGASAKESARRTVGVRRYHMARRYTELKQNIALPYQQSDTRVIDGQHALLSKPSGMKGCRVLKSRHAMRKVAKSRRFGDYFMAYRMATTVHGRVYYKIVSYNFKYRGWMSAKSLHSVKTSRKARTLRQRRVFFRHPARNKTYVYPYRSIIYNPVIAKNMNKIAHDPLEITATRKTYRGRVKSYYVTDRHDPKINGWVRADEVSDHPSKDSDQHFDRNSEVRIDFANNGRVFKRSILPDGGTERGQNVTKNLTGANKPLSNDTWGNNQLSGTGYAVRIHEHANRDALSHIKSGSTVVLNVYKTDNAHSKLDLHVEGAQGRQPFDIYSNGAAEDDFVALPKSYSRKEKSSLVGDSSDSISKRAIESAFFDGNDNMAALDGTATYTVDSSGQEVYVPRADIANHNQNDLYHYIYKYDPAMTHEHNKGKKYGSVLDIYYSRQKADGSANPLPGDLSGTNSILVNADQGI